MKASLGWLAAAVFVVPGHAEDLYFYNWSEYLPDEVIEQFEAETGIDVHYDTYDSNESMYAKVKLVEGGGYDLVVPSTYYVNRMRQEGLLLPIDQARLQNFDHLDPALLDKPYDPGNEYSVPYLWGSTGMMVNTDAIDAGKVQGWDDLWRDEFAGQILLTDDVREVFGMALRTLGHSGNTTDPEQIKAAYEKLRGLVAGVRVFNSESPKEPYLMGEVNVGMQWSGEAFVAQGENPALQYVYPEEGVILWMDSLVIPRGAKNVDAAHRMIDFLLRPDIAAKISGEIGYSTPNLAALENIPDEVRNNPVAYPPKEILEAGEFQLDVGDAIRVYEEYWERLKAGG